MPDALVANLSVRLSAVFAKYCAVFDGVLCGAVGIENVNAHARIDGGVTSPKGYRAAGVHAGIKDGGPDLALIVSSDPAAVAGTFTLNKVQGPTVALCRERLAGGKATAVVANSGNANACTGPGGRKDADRMGAVAAQCLAVDEQSVFVCSTGVIGVPLPIDDVEAGIRVAAGELSAEGGNAAARAIMTTDTVTKEAAVEIELGGVTVTVGGMAKGAGMIEPNMATMLAFLTTDAKAAPGPLQACLSAAVDASFNRISVDGDQSCNDTVLLLANGAAGAAELDEHHKGWGAFTGAVRAVARDLALKIVEDGEGATKFVTVNVTGAASDDDARKVARQVANSLLVKTSWYGEDPNWGRVIDAAGHAGAELKQELVSISYDDVPAVKHGMAAPDVPLSELERILKQDRFSVNIELRLGKGSYTVYTCDCSEEYVRINSEYTT